MGRLKYVCGSVAVIVTNDVLLGLIGWLVECFNAKQVCLLKLLFAGFLFQSA